MKYDTQIGAIVPCCVHLRSRTMFFVPDEMRAGPGHIRVCSTGGYWCNRTSTPMGPDDACATPGGCQPGRACHQPADES